MRNGITTSPWSTARSVPRLIWGDSLALVEKIRTKIFAPKIPSMIDSPHARPARMSRGAIQQE